MGRQYGVKQSEPLTFNENGQAVVDAVTAAGSSVIDAGSKIMTDIVSGRETSTVEQSFVRCPYCGSRDVSIQMVESGQMTTRKGVGLGGHANNAARAVAAFTTLGMSNLVWKKNEGTQKTKTIMSKVGICQTCGHDWVIDEQKFGSAPKSIFR